MGIKFKNTGSEYKIFDGNRLIGYAEKRSDGWYVSPGGPEWNGPHATRKKAGSYVRSQQRRNV